MMPRPAASSRDMMSFNSASGVISNQSDAQKSAPKTAIFCDASHESSGFVSAKPGKRKNGTCGVSGDRAASP